MAKQVAKSKLDKMVKAYINDVKTEHIKVGDDEVDIEVKHTLPYHDYLAAVNDFADLVFTTDDTGKEVYRSEDEEFARRYVFLKYFTNIDMDPRKKDGEADPNFVSRVWSVYQMMYDTDDGWVEPSIMYTICSAALDRIKEKRKEIEPGAASFWKTLSDFADEMKEQFGEMSEEDVKNASAAMAKLASIGESDIIKALK